MTDIPASPTQPTPSEGNPSCPFPFGLRVLFRSQGTDGYLHYMLYPSARAVKREREQMDFFTIEDESGGFLGLHHIDTIAAINPIVPEGASDVKDPPKPA